MLRADLYARVSTTDQTLAMQNRAMREYAARRGWTVAFYRVRDVNSGGHDGTRARSYWDAARPREIDVGLVWRLDRWGRSVADLLGTLQELEHLGVGSYH